MENNKLSEKDLLSKLVNAKKIMNKVDSGNFARGNVNINDSINENYDINNTPNFENDLNYSSVNTVSKPIVNEDKIKQSKLPDAIKQIMIDKPIQQIKLEDSNVSLFENARKIIEKNGLKKESKSTVKQHSESKLDTKNLAILIENIVRKVMDEKFNELKNNHDSLAINENLALKVGDSIFTGTITKVKKKNK